MEITSIHKYISLNKQANGATEVLFSGQPCLTVSENMMGNVWKINPVFAKLVYGANVFEDIPQCIEPSNTTEESVAAGLVKLHELGAFNTEVDFPEDSYAATMNAISEEVKQHTLKECENIVDAAFKFYSIMESIKNNKFPVLEGDRSEYSANMSLANTDHNSGKTKRIILKHPSGSVISRHSTEDDAVKSFKKLKDTYGVKIMREETESDITVELLGEETGKEKKEEKEIATAIKKDKKFVSKVDCGDCKDDKSK